MENLLSNGMPANSTIIYNETLKRVTLNLGTNFFQVNQKMVIKIKNITDIESNFVYPINNYKTASYFIWSTTNVPSAEIFETNDKEQTIYLKYNLNVKNADIISNYKIKINNLNPLTIGGGSTIVSIPHSEKSEYFAYKLTLNTTYFHADDLVNLVISNVQNVDDDTPTIPATGYYTQPFVAQDYTGPTAKIIDADEILQTVIIEYNEGVKNTLADDINNYQISTDDGASFFYLTAAEGSIVDYQTTDNRAYFTIGNNINFKGWEKLKFRIYVVEDIYGNSIQPDSSTPYVTPETFLAPDKTKPTAVITFARDSDQKVTIQFSESVKNADLITNYHSSKDNGASFDVLTSGGGSSVTYFGGGLANVVIGDGINFSGGESVILMVNNVLDDRDNPTNPASGYRTPVYIAEDRISGTAEIEYANQLTQTIKIKWSESMLNAEKIENFKLIKNGGAQISLTADSSVVYNNASLTTILVIEPAAAFVESDKIVISILTTQSFGNKGVTDLSGNMLSTLNYYETPEKTVVDQVNPTAYITVARDHDQRVAIKWSENVNSTTPTIINDPSNISYSIDGGTTWIPLTVASSFLYQSDPTNLQTITLNEGTPIKGGDVIRFRYSNVVDSVSNPTVPAMNYELDPFPVADTTGPIPTILSATDFENEIKIQWSESLLTTGAVYASLNGAPEIQIDGSGNGTYTYDANTFIYTITSNPGMDLSAGDVLNFKFLLVTDLLGNEAGIGNTVITYIHPDSFIVTDTTPPVAVIDVAGDNQKITVGFDSDVTGADAITNYLISDNNGVSYTQLTAPAVATYDATTKKATISLNGYVTLVPNTTVRLALNNIADVYGNKMTNFTVIGPATVTDNQPPTITSVSVRGFSMVIEFSEAMDQTSVETPGNFNMEVPFGIAYNFAVADFSYDNPTRTLTITDVLFDYTKTYKLVLTNVKDTQNNVISSSNINIGTVDSVVELHSGTPFAMGELSGDVSTVLFNIPSGLAMKDDGTRIYASMKGSHKIYRFDTSTSLFAYYSGGLGQGFADGVNNSAQFNSPMGITWNSSNNDIYVADTDNNTIRRIDDGSSTSDTVTTLAGIGPGAGAGYIDGATGVAKFNSPKGICYIAGGYFYVADSGNHLIREISLVTFMVSTFAGDGSLISGLTNGPKASARFNDPVDVIKDSLGNFYVSDKGNHVIRKIDILGEVTTFAGAGIAGFGDGTGSGAAFFSPHGLAIDEDDNIFVADYGNNKIRRITPAGVVTTVAGSSPGYANGSGISSKFNGPMGIMKVYQKRELLVTDSNNQVIRRIKY